MTDSLHSSLPQEMKMPCGCYGEYRQGNTQTSWVVTAEAFLCKQKHKQGQVVVVETTLAAAVEQAVAAAVVLFESNSLVSFEHAKPVAVQVPLSEWERLLEAAREAST